MSTNVVSTTALPYTRVYLHAQTAVDAGDIYTWRILIIRITEKKKKTWIPQLEPIAMASTYVSPVSVSDFIKLVINKSTFAWLASLLGPPSRWRRFLRLVLNGVKSYMPVCTCSTRYKSTVKNKLKWSLHQTYYRDCEVLYARYFHTGHSIFHCCLMKYDHILWT